MTNNDPIHSLMMEQANKQLLKFAVSRQMFCPTTSCGTILDMRRAVLATIKAPTGAEQEIIACESCWERFKPNVEGLAKARGLTLTVLDGRELWKQPAAKPKTKAATRNKARAATRNEEILERAMAAMEEGELLGICTACGHSEDGYEPDARKRTCESCGEPKVYGAEELIVMLG